MSRERIQNYLRRNHIQELFEEMMQKIVHDFPANPLHYLIELLEMKTTEHKHIMRSQVVKPSRSKTPVQFSATMTTVEDLKKSPSKTMHASVDLNRTYDKPWKSNSRSSTAKPRMIATTDGNFKSLTKSKDSKIKMTKEDKERSNPFGEEEDIDLGLVYASPKVIGDPLSGSDMTEELSSTGYDAGVTESDEVVSTKHGKKLSAKEHKKKRLAELKALTESRLSNNQKERITENKLSDGEFDEALEMLEDADVLKEEGVKNPGKSGFITNSNSSKKEEIEVVLNMSKFFDELGGTLKLNPAEDGGKKSMVDDEDFESASQVTGPRVPVWEVPGSDVMSNATLTNKPNDKIDLEMFDIKSQNNKSIKSPTPSEKGRTTRPKTSGGTPTKSRSQVNGDTKRGSTSSRVSVCSAK